MFVVQIQLYNRLNGITVLFFMCMSFCGPKTFLPTCHRSTRDCPPLSPALCCREAGFCHVSSLPRAMLWEDKRGKAEEGMEQAHPGHPLRLGVPPRGVGKQGGTVSRLVDTPSPLVPQIVTQVQLVDGLASVLNLRCLITKFALHEPSCRRGLC